MATASSDVQAETSVLCEA